MNIKCVYLISLISFSMICMEEDRNTDKNKLNKQLEEAVLSHDIKGVESLLKKGANPNFEYVIPVLMMPMYEYNLEIIKLLIKFGANLNFKSKSIGESFLALAATLKRPKMVKLFINSGSNIHDARLKEHINNGLVDEETKKIIEDKIDLRNRLFKAIEEGNYNLVKDLILKVAPIKDLRKKVLLVATNIYGDNILHAAVKARNSKDSKKIVEFIFAIAPDLAQEKNNAGQTPIELAANNSDVLKIFMFKKPKGEAPESILGKRKREDEKK